VIIIVALQEGLVDSKIIQLLFVVEFEIVIKYLCRVACFPGFFDESFLSFDKEVLFDMALSGLALGVDGAFFAC
jgi:hypothetical protein